MENNSAEASICELLRRALAEDLGAGDVTTESIVPDEQRLSGRLTVKEDGILAGMNIAKEIFSMLDPETEFRPLAGDGEKVFRGQKVAEVEGKACSILSAERTVLNIMQRMSGIATASRGFVDAVAGTSAVILDTRKTAPGLRVLDKLAVRTGGGRNHRFGLFDMVLIKENHITAAGGITEAVERCRKRIPDEMEVEVEVRNLDELREALSLDVDRILLDNMSERQMAEAVGIAGGRTPLEASGNVTIDRAAGIAATGVDFISVGSLTHSVRALDISLVLAPEVV